MAPFGFGFMYPSQQREATEELNRVRTETLTLPLAVEVTELLPLGESQATNKFKTEPVLPHLITPELVLRKMTEGQWESALRLLEISSGLRA